MSKYAYKLVTATSPGELEHQVNHYCKHGYEPVGAVVVLPAGGFGQVMQSLVREYGTGGVTMPARATPAMIAAAQHREHEIMCPGVDPTSHTWQGLSAVVIAKLYEAMVEAAP